MSTSKDTILVLGGTGKVGSRVTPLLSENGNKIIVASRSGKSPSLPNTEGVKFDWDDSTTFASPFEKASFSSVFLVAPIAIVDALSVMKPFIDLAVEKGVKRFVLLNATPLDIDDPHTGAVFKYIKSLGVDYANLRPTWFFENFTEGEDYEGIRDQDKIFTAAGDGKVPFVSAFDIAAVAFRALTDEDSHNTDHFIVGPDLYSYDDCAAILSRALSRKIIHVKLSPQGFADLFAQYGVPRDFVDMFTQMHVDISNGKEVRQNDVIFEVTGRRPRTFEEYVRGVC